MGELESNVDVIRRLLRAFNARDDAAVLALVDPGIVFAPLVQGLDTPEPYRGEMGVRRYLAEVRRRWERLRVEPSQVRAIGDTVVVFAELEAHGEADALRAPVTSVWRVREGRVAHGVLVSRDSDAAHPAAPAPFLVEVPATPASVAEARDAVEEWAEELGASPAEIAALRLCVSEAVTNSILHAYLDCPPGLVRVSALAEGGEVVLSVEDEGCGMRPHPDSPGLGMGLPLMGQMAGSLNIVSVPERARGCCLRMTFRVAALGLAPWRAHAAVSAAR
jgi:serine/threonine-protein kinase RsbW/stage II sporulation protein AB (anti-sigma F factor)